MSELRLTLPMIGPEGERDNVARLTEVLQALAPRGTVTTVAVMHDEGCPCTENGLSIEACTCDEVDLLLTSEGADSN